MSAYLKFFELERSPFEGKAQAQVVLGTKALRDAFALIRDGLDEGDARICVSGGPGLGKTSLARALPKLLGDAARVAVVLDPDVSWESLRGSIAKQWGLATGGIARAALIKAARDRRLVLVIDQAERASEEFLDHLDIVLSYRSETDEPVVQSVLLARLSGSDQQELAPIVWWLDRIQTLQLEFAPLRRDGIESYIHKHLKRAGWRGEQIFSKEAALAIHEYTGGIPGEISRLCEGLLAEAAARDHHDISAAFVRSLCDEGEPDDEPGIEDEFEGIEFGKEFDDADATTHSEPSTIDLKEIVSEPARPSTLAKTLEHFETDEEETDEAPVFQDDPLWAPASPEELRAILGSVLGRHGRAFAAAAIAALIGGLAIAWLAGDAGPSESIAAGGSELTGLGRADPIESRSTADSEAAPAVLARLRGPVSTTGNTPAAPTPAAAAATEPKSLEIFDEDFEEEEISEDDLVDMRPAAMLPDSTVKSPPEERFW
jgi:MSHA biogenesis protein MshM